MKVPYIDTKDGVTVVLKGRPYNVSASNPRYQDVLDELDTDGSEDTILAIIDSTARKLQEKLRLAPGMEYSGGVVLYRGEAMHNYAVDRLVGMIEGGRDYKPLAAFLAKLEANPSKRVVDHLYKFLEAGSIPLTEDGDFLAYKAVRANYMDIHSGTFSNALGAVCEMPRNRVDEDPSRTCSNGLHVCSFAYLPHFSHANGHVMIVKVSPADVVAIPADYNDTKMRVSRYEVIGEVEGYYEKPVDVLGDVGRKSGVQEPGYTVYDDNEFDVGCYYGLEEAKRQAQRTFEELGYGEDEEVTVQDDEGYVLLTVDVNGAR